MLTATGVLSGAALLCAIASAARKEVPLWVAVVLLSVVELLRVLPVGR